MNVSQFIQNLIIRRHVKITVTYEFSESNLSFAELDVHALSNRGALKSGDDLHF